MQLEHCPANLNCGLLTECINGICVHDSVFPLSLYTSLVYILCPILIGIGMVGGLGGGILKGPILIMMLNYEQVYATFISYCIMFGGCFFNTFLVMRKQHPIDPSRPIVSYDLAMIFNCSIALGTYFGGTLNIFLPEFVCIVIQEIFLLFVIPLLVKEGHNEKRRLNQIRNKDLQIEAIEQVLINKEDQASALTSDQLVVDLIKEHSSYFPKRKILIISSFFIVSQLIMTGGKQFKESISLPRCFDINYLLLLILICINIPMTYILYKYGQYQDKIKDQYSLYIDERYFKRNRFIFVYLSGFGAGLSSGLIGLGAGLIMIPSMLHLGVHPRVAAGTSGFNYIFIGFTSIIKLFIDNLLKKEEIIWYTSLAIIGGLVFSKLGYYFVEKYQLTFCVILIVIGLAFMNLIAGIYLPITQSIRFGFETMLEFGVEC